MKKGQLSNLLRQLGLLYAADWTRYYLEKLKNRKANQRFKLDHPHVALPPDYLIYESFQLNYQKYYTESRATAKWLVSHFENHTELKDKKLLDWGCGPGRLIRHLPEIIGNGCAYYGTDYNEKSIAWCSKHLPDIHFNNNSLKAQLPYDDHFMDIIYGISIFTHLSEALHYDWYAELYRVLKPGGIMFLTTHGDNFKIKLTASELKTFNNQQLVVRGKVKEGHRTYSTFQPKGFMENLFSNVEILEHIETPPKNENWLPQDIWIIRKH